MLEEIDKVRGEDEDDNDERGSGNDDVGESSGIQFDRQEGGLLLERRLFG